MSEQASSDSLREPKCGDWVCQIFWGKGEVTAIEFDQNENVNGFTVLFDSGVEKTFRFPISFEKGMRYLEEVDSRINPSNGCVKVGDVQNSSIIKNSYTYVDQSKELLEKLIDLRTRLSREENLPSYYIFSDRVLTRMAEEQPTSKEEMIRVSGIGEKNYSKYGVLFLNLICEFKESNYK